jgi:hypothetical protein
VQHRKRQVPCSAPRNDAHAITSARSMYTLGVALPRALRMEPCVPGKAPLYTKRAYRR